MKLTLVFLSTLLVLSHQQFYRPMDLTWLIPQANYYQPFYYKNYQEESPLIREFRPSRPTPYYQNELMNQDLVVDAKTIDNEDEKYPQPDVNLRFKGLQNKPAFYDNQNPRFFLFGTASTLNIPFLRTATFIVTSVVNITSVQTCVTATEFIANAPPCRRKKRNIDMALMKDSDYDQFQVAPTETQRVESTMSPDLLQDQSNQSIYPHGLTSSKQETDVNNESELQNGKQKRFLLNQLFASTTITSYSFITTVVTKTVKLLPAGAAVSALCRPSGYVNC